jgi:DNA repair protein RAD5
MTIGDRSEAQSQVDMADLDSRPAKKRRFFADDFPSAEQSMVSDGQSPTPPAQDTSSEENSPGPIETIPKSTDSGTTDTGFDKSLLEAVVGDSISDSLAARLKQLSNGDIERGE